MSENLDKDIIFVDKPKGFTSLDVVKVVKKKFNIKKAGHAGTLDPNATGLLVVGIGKGTKKLKDYVGLPKTYEAEILLGVSTDSGDIEGKVLRMEKVKLKNEKIKKAVEGMKGKWVLPVSKFSAMKQGGEALYKKARAGKKIVQPKREMEILESKFLNLESTNEGLLIKAEFEVSSGTYVRSIAEEVGRRLDVPATLYNLRRTKVGEYSIEGSIELDRRS